MLPLLYRSVPWVISAFIVACGRPSGEAVTLLHSPGEAGVLLDAQSSTSLVLSEHSDACIHRGRAPMGLLSGTIILDDEGQSMRVGFELPEGASSMTIVLEGPQDVHLIAKSLEGPRGILIDDDGDLYDAQFDSPNRALASLGLAAALLPNNPLVNVDPGAYILTVSGARSGRPFEGEVDVKILYKTDRGRSPCIDVHMYLTGALELQAKTAQDSELLAQTIQRLRTIYRQAELEIGRISYHDIDAKFQTRSFSLTGNAEEDDLAEMFELSSLGGPGLHVFLVERLESGAREGILAGVSGGIPGPPLSPGSSATGVAIAAGLAKNNPRLLAQLIGHETGHYLGLFHTVEGIASEASFAQDQIPDTPEGARGTSFLMYPALAGGEDISPQQAEVIARHPEVVTQ